MDALGLLGRLALLIVLLVPITAALPLLEASSIATRSHVTQDFQDIGIHLLKGIIYNVTFISSTSC